MKTAVENGFLRASATPVDADAYLIAVPTPFKGDHEPDMVYVEAAAKSIAPVLKKGALVILESTSPVGATEQMAAWLAEMRADLTFPQQVGEQADVNIACQYRLRQRTVADLRRSGDQRLGTDSAGKPPSTREYFAARPWRRWTLYRGRSVVYRGAEPAAGEIDPYCT